LRYTVAVGKITESQGKVNRDGENEMKKQHVTIIAEVELDTIVRDLSTNETFAMKHDAPPKGSTVGSEFWVVRSPVTGQLKLTSAPTVAQQRRAAKIAKNKAIEDALVGARERFEAAVAAGHLKHGHAADAASMIITDLAKAGFKIVRA